mmetsp:Transcript_11046/g.27527  ORF Transcript_11046/g.27527 Transcript_11046/m.27527 type:complete len:169 (+) Transcript_11046:885-1391(+)
MATAANGGADGVDGAAVGGNLWRACPATGVDASSIGHGEAAASVVASAAAGVGADDGVGAAEDGASVDEVLAGEGFAEACCPCPAAAETGVTKPDCMNEPGPTLPTAMVTLGLSNACRDEVEAEEALVRMRRPRGEGQLWRTTIGSMDNVEDGASRPVGMGRIPEDGL